MPDPLIGLDEYEVQLAALRIENELLRQSARTFGDLAERLNDALNVATEQLSATRGESRSLDP